MNIIVKPYGSELCYCRPDTTWERENKDFYSPECVDELYWSPVMFARICKAGKCIGEKFVTRYYDAVGFGVLLYIGKGDTAFTSCADHTSLLPMPLYNPVVLQGKDNFMEVSKDDVVILKEDTSEVGNLIGKAVCNASRLTSLRIGDFVAVETRPAERLVSRHEGKAGLKASYCGNELFDFRIFF